MSSKLDEPRGLAWVAHGHDGSATEQSPELHALARLFARHGNQADGGRFLVNHANRHFVRDDGGDRFGCLKLILSLLF